MGQQIQSCSFLLGVNGNASLQQELTEYNGGQDFDGLEHFAYNNSRFVDVLFGHLNDTDFDGITVRSSYLHHNHSYSNYNKMMRKILLSLYHAGQYQI